MTITTEDVEDDSTSTQITAKHEQTSKERKDLRTMLDPLLNAAHHSASQYVELVQPTMSFFGKNGVDPAMSFVSSNAQNLAGKASNCQSPSAWMGSVRYRSLKEGAVETISNTETTVKRDWNPFLGRILAATGSDITNIECRL
jgi:hypothetical protein